MKAKTMGGREIGLQQATLDSLKMRLKGPVIETFVGYALQKYNAGGRKPPQGGRQCPSIPQATGWR
jgi:hypothetical protein